MGQRRAVSLRAGGIHSSHLLPEPCETNPAAALPPPLACPGQLYSQACSLHSLLSAAASPIIWALREREREASAMGDANGHAPVGGGEAGWNSEAERKKVALMRARMEEEDPAVKDVDDQTLRRFLRACDLDIKKASSLFLKYLRWRRTLVPKGSISEEEIQNELSQDKIFMQGYDKKGHPIGIFMAGKHDYSKGNIDEFRRVIVYCLDKLCSRMAAGQEKFIFIGDIQGWSYSNCDMRAYLAALDIMQNYYPERLGKVFVIHAPSVFMRVWKIIYRFIDKNTKQKFVFVDDKNLKETLLEDIDESQLPDMYGGKLPLVRLQEVGSSASQEVHPSSQ